MAKFDETTLQRWTLPPSETEQQKLQNAETAVRTAISSDKTLQSKSIEVFGQGSYANDTNIRLNSDIDINACYNGGFYFQLPAQRTREEFGLTSPSAYSFEEYKDDVETALVNKFGRSDVVRHDKCITINGNSYRVETDVVPTWKHRRYSEDKSYVEGVVLYSDKGKKILNYPKQHLSNSLTKNTNTARRFKRLVRIVKRVKQHMEENNEQIDESICSFLIECLVYNVPNYVFNDGVNWNDRLKKAVYYLHRNTRSDGNCDDWGEVSELLYLFHSGRKWTISTANNFLFQMWKYLEY